MNIKNSGVVQAFESIKKKEYAKKPFVVGPKTTTYGQLIESALKLTGIFKKAGLKPGDKVILSTVDNHAHAVIFLSLLRNGLTAVVIDPNVKNEKFQNILNIVRPRGFIVDSPKRTEWEIPPHKMTLFIDELKSKTTLFSKLLGKKNHNNPQNANIYTHLMSVSEPVQPPDEIDEMLDAYILFTSGTTASPKGVRIGHRALFKHLQTLSNQYQLTENSRILNILKRHHADGLVQGAVLAFFNSATVYSPFDFEIAKMGELLDMIYTYRISHFMIVPTMLSLIERLGSDYTDVFNSEDFKMLICSADVLHCDIWLRFEEKFQVQIANVYGLTETVAGGLFCMFDGHTRKIGTVGRPIDCQVKLIDEHGDLVDTGQVGQLLIKGDNLMSGYLSNNPETEDCINDGWFSTGDLFTKDKEGFYHIKGRLKNLIISGGNNIIPEEISDVLRQKQGIVDVVTIGMEDSVFGQKVVSCVVAAENVALNEEALFNHCRQYLELEKVPSEIYFVKKLPKSAAGKPILSDVSAMIKKIKGNARFQGDYNNVEDLICECAAVCFKQDVSYFDMGMSSDDILGWDSLSHLEFVATLENRTGVTFSITDIMNIDSLNNAAQITKHKLNN